MSPRRWVPTLVAVDAVLVAALLVVVLLVVVIRPGGSTQSPVPGGSGTAAAPGSGGGNAGPGPAATPGPPRFRLPSGNIACDMTADGVTCTVASATFTPPPATGCTGTVGHTVVLDAHGVSVPCVQGPAPTVAGDDVPMLFYASTSTVGQYTCTSATNGVTCTNAKGVGFRLARASLTTLP
ncbi:MAG TPA: hypothetical protein VGC04_04910 [Cellulomonas sp.]